jgi:two-component system OmpR family response regulator
MSDRARALSAIRQDRRSATAIRGAPRLCYAMRMHVLIAEDDPLLCDGLARALGAAGHTVDVASDGEAADRKARTNAHDLVVLDVGLPSIDGFEVLRRLRARGDATRVMMLTARDAIADRVHGLDLGADDYLTKPFSLDEFEARVRALARRPEASGTQQLEIGPMQVDLAAKRLRIRGIGIELTSREWALLGLFLRSPGRVLSKDEIIEGLCSAEEQVTPNTIEVYVSRLRAKLEPAGVRVRTVRGFGYLWNSQADGA